MTGVLRFGVRVELPEDDPRTWDGDTLQAITRDVEVLLQKYQFGHDVLVDVELFEVTTVEQEEKDNAERGHDREG